MISDATPDTELDRHEGKPITRLESVRNDYNAVAAVADLPAARGLIIALEDSGIEPEKISLLGAWPIQNEFSPPHRITSRAAAGLLKGAVAGVATGAVALKTSRRFVVLIAGAVGGLLGAALGASVSIGRSGAWRQSLAADGSGTVAVGVHSTDVLDVVTGEGVMHRHRPLSVRRFEGRSTSA